MKLFNKIKKCAEKIKSDGGLSGICKKISIPIESMV